MEFVGFAKSSQKQSWRNLTQDNYWQGRYRIVVSDHPEEKGNLTELWFYGTGNQVDEEIYDINRFSSRSFIQKKEIPDLLRGRGFSVSWIQYRVLSNILSRHHIKISLGEKMKCR